MPIVPKQPSIKGTSEWFTGDVYIDPVARGDQPSRIQVNAVHFTPGARTAWHSHGLGQTLYVTEGVGLIQSRGDEVREIHAGDVIHALGRRALGWRRTGPLHDPSLYDRERARLPRSLGRSRDRRRVRVRRLSPGKMFGPPGAGTVRVSPWGRLVTVTGRGLSHRRRSDPSLVADLDAALQGRAPRAVAGLLGRRGLIPESYAASTRPRARSHSSVGASPSSRLIGL